MSFVPSFDALQTRQDSSHGASIDVIFVVAPWLETVEFPDPDGDGTQRIVRTYGWNTALMTEQWAVGRYLDRNLGYSDAVPGPEMFTTCQEANALQGQWSTIVDLLNRARERFMNDASIMIPADPPAPIFVRDRFFLPELTSDGGYVSLETNIYKCFGAQRLQLELRRNIAPNGKGPANDDLEPPRRDTSNAGRHYFIAVRRDGWIRLQDATNNPDSAGNVPTSYKAGIVYAATEHVEDAGRLVAGDTIPVKHERDFPGALDKEVFLRINGETVDLGSITRSMVFQNVQDYSPPTEFVRACHVEQQIDPDTVRLPTLPPAENPRIMDPPKARPAPRIPVDPVTPITLAPHTRVVVENDPLFTWETSQSGRYDLTFPVLEGDRIAVAPHAFQREGNWYIDLPLSL